ncbi:MAG: toxic anion resistance protein [bacterium]
MDSIISKPAVDSIVPKPAVNSIVPKPADEVATGLSTLTEDEKTRVHEIMSTIQVEDSQFVLQYGVGIQSKISSFADSILNQIRAKDAGYVGEIMTDLMVKVKDLDVDSLSSDHGFFSKIPFLGSLFNEAEKFVAKYEKLSTQIEKIIQELDKARMDLLRDLTMLDTLYDKNVEYFKELNLYILAGEQKLKELQDVTLPKIKAEAEASNDPLAAQNYRDFQQLIIRFEKKLHDLKLSKMVALQTAPQIRIIQNNNEVLTEKIQSSILNTIPLWKNQIVIAVSLLRQKKALQIQKEVTDTTNELLQKNAELLKESSLGVAKESERGVVDLETLRKVNSDLIATIEETLRIHEEGRAKRQEAEVELTKIEGELKQKLMSVKQ